MDFSCLHTYIRAKNHLKQRGSKLSQKFKLAHINLDEREQSCSHLRRFITNSFSNDATREKTLLLDWNFARFCLLLACGPRPHICRLCAVKDFRYRCYLTR